MALWCGTVGKSGLDLTEALLMRLLLCVAWDASLCLYGNTFIRNEWLGVTGGWGVCSMAGGAEQFLTHWVLQGTFPCLGIKYQVLFRLTLSQCCAAAGTTFIHCTSFYLAKWTKSAKRGCAHPRSHSPHVSAQKQHSPWVQFSTQHCLPIKT